MEVRHLCYFVAVAEAYAILSRFDECMETMRRARAGSDSATIRIGLIGEFSHSWGSDFVAEVGRQYPHYVLAVEATPSAAQIDVLLTDPATGTRQPRSQLRSPPCRQPRTP
jgi:DNA-binding transcriptional LysR family regulator